VEHVKFLTQGGISHLRALELTQGYSSLGASGSVGKTPAGSARG
jgi:hypothetical protein